VSIRLLTREEALSVCVVTFADDLTTPYIVVGTAIIFEDDDAPKFGRLLLYRYKNGHLTFASEKEVNAAPHTMAAFQNKLLVAVGSSVSDRNRSFLVQRPFRSSSDSSLQMFIRNT
jgi:hypothetical protein